MHDGGARGSAVGTAIDTVREGPLRDANGPPQTVALTLAAVDRTFVTEDEFIAAVEMQLSGEPFASAMGRRLDGYSRTYSCSTDECQASLYVDSTGDGRAVAMVDLAGFSAAIESYEYSKQPMNNVAFESGAGTSLLFGPVLNPTSASGASALRLAQTWFVHMGGASNVSSRFASTSEAGVHGLGWPGLWPTLQPFSSWNPAIQPTHETGCRLSSDDSRGSRGSVLSNQYECDYTTLNLPHRQAQVSMTIGPGASGWSAWKEALWTLNYLQSMHGSKEQAVAAVAPRLLTKVGLPGNAVVGNLFPGTYLGSSSIEGFQAGNFIEILDNQAAQWLSQLTTSDGATLGGFAALSDALAYDPRSALRWFPSSIKVTEAPDPSGFPRPVSYAIAAADSRLLDLAGLLGAFSTVYALTDRANLAVGGSQPVMAYFDGDPFPVQNQTPTGAATLHDRALAMIRVAVVNMDRMHVDPASGIFVDTSGFSGGHAARGTTLSADVAAYTLMSLRTARRALDSQLTLYGNTRPDTHGIPSPLDRFPLAGGLSFSERLDQLIASLARLFEEKLTTADGRAYAGWDVTRAAPTDDGSSLEAHAAAIRGLLLAYLATGATLYRDRAARVFARLESSFYDPAARVYRTAAGDRSAQITFTPRLFGLLQGALRDLYELVGVLPGQSIGPLLEDRFGRLNKLVLNGWDDRNGDGIVEWPSECAGLGVGPDGQPLGLGGLQMAERALSGETGSMPDAPGGQRIVATDREHDCVPEISAVGLPSALAASVTFALVPWSPAHEGQVLRDGTWVGARQPPQERWGAGVRRAAPVRALPSPEPAVPTTTVLPARQATQTHSSAMTLSPDHARLFVAHPDADSVTFVDLATRTIAREVLLASARPAMSAAGRYEPAVEPRALALDSKGATLYVTGQRSGRLYAVNAATGATEGDVAVCAEPVGVLVSADDARVYVACSQDDEVLELRAEDRSLAAMAACPRKPWALAWGADGDTLLATHFLGPGVSAFSTSPLSLKASWTLPDGPKQRTPTDPTEPHGQVRGLYDALVRPGTSELWVAHLMLGTDTPQPALDFRQTVFPSLSILGPEGRQLARLSVRSNPGDGEAFGDVVSGPHALAFSDDGALAFVVDSNSEDVLIVDAAHRVESQIVRPLPGHMPESIVSAGGTIYVQERNTEDVVAFRVSRDSAGVTVVPDGLPFPSLSSDPMPGHLRLGQRLFYSANSDDLPVTQDHWVACASCHLEGRSDAVTWLFAQGPRDTPSNAGGLLDTGFLFRTADRTKVQDYWRTINVEQGGHFQLTDPKQARLLDALADFVNQAIPTPVAPSMDAAHALWGTDLASLRARGETVFAELGCPSCHTGRAKTDSAGGNAGRLLDGRVVLHDVGTCATGSFPDVAHKDIAGHDRAACAFDTPALRGLVDSAPYFHDGSATTLIDVLPTMLRAAAGTRGTPVVLSADQQTSLVEYLRSL